MMQTSREGEHGIECVTVRIKAEIGFLNDIVPKMFNRKPVHVCFLAETSSGKKLHFCKIRYAR